MLEWPFDLLGVQREREAEAKRKAHKDERAWIQGQLEEVKAVGRSVCWLVGWLLHVPATCTCISGTGLLGQFYVMPP